MEVVMKKGFTDKGVSLVVLIVVITVVGILGAGIVSFMGVKQRSYPAQAQAYQALNLAHAGIEFAIRYANDRFEENQESLSESISKCGTGKSINFGNGKFTICYDDQKQAIKSIGEVGIAKREVWLNKPGSYVTGKGLFLTKIINDKYPPIQGCYDDCPSHQQNQYISIPVTNDYEQDVYIKHIEITLIPAQGSSNLLSGLYSGSTIVYDASNDKKNPNYLKKGKDSYICIPEPGGTENCKKTCPNPQTPAKIPYDYNLNLRIPPGPSTDILDFKSASIKGTYTLKFYFDFDTNYKNINTATMTFTIE